VFVPNPAEPEPKKLVKYAGSKFKVLGFPVALIHEHMNLEL
jgi:hypothetical protein